MKRDPLETASEKIWAEIQTLLRRHAELERAPTSDARDNELYALGSRLRQLRRLSERFCGVLRDEAWARGGE